MILQGEESKLKKQLLDIKEACRVSAHSRATLARQQKMWITTGSADGSMALYNYLGPHIDRLSSYLYSPTDLRFTIDYENHYQKEDLIKAEMAARVLTRHWERRDIDILVGAGVEIALAFGACIAKQMWDDGGLAGSLVMPWQFGVYREDRNGLGAQEAMCETTYITQYDLWRRISHRPDARDLFKRAIKHARKNAATDDEVNYFHQVVLAGTSPYIQTNPAAPASPGGMMPFTSDASYQSMGPEVAGDLLCMHEMYVVDDEVGDYTTVQIVDPDIIVAPYFKKRNFFAPHRVPYSLIQANRVQGYLWGKSEIADLLMLQSLLTERMDDYKKIMALQYGKLLAFIGFDGMNDELYDQFRSNGYVSTSMPGAKVEDLTPKVPDHALEEINMIISMMNEASGFKNILSGQGETGVRAAEHAQMLLKTASPRLRDRALLVERAVADMGDLSLDLLAAKQAKAYWVDATTNERSEFLLSQLHEDRRVTVDSHSSSPIYEDDHKQVVAFLAKMGAIDGESILDLLQVPNRDILKIRLKERDTAKQKFLQEHPEVISKMASHKR